MTHETPVPRGALPSGAPPAEYPSGPPLAPPPSPVPPGALRPGATWPGAEPPLPAPSGPNRRPWIVVAALAAAVALVAAALAVFDGDDTSREASDPPTFERDDPPPSTTPAPGPDPEPEPDPGEELEDVIADIRDFVEAERGLEFLEDPVVELVDDAEFEDRLLEDFDEEVAELETGGRVLEALGLLPPGTDVVQAMRDMLGGGIVGFYDPSTNELVVRGTEPTPYVRTVIAHELVHALDDQHFELDRPELEEATDERPFGFDAIVEGNARRIEQAYRATFTPAEEEQAFFEELLIGGADRLLRVPEALLVTMLAPYELGPELVRELLAAGGQARLDAAFGDPPVSSEQVLEPDAYLDGDAPRTDLPPISPEGDVFDEGVIGAFTLAVMLGQTSLLGFGPFSPAVEGWGGDRYVAWSTPEDGTCVRAVFVGDTDADTDAIAAELEAWAADPPFGVVAGTGAVGEGAGRGVELTSCSG